MKHHKFQPDPHWGDKQCTICGFPKRDITHEEQTLVEFDYVRHGGEAWSTVMGADNRDHGKLKARDLSAIYRTEVRVYCDGTLKATYRNGSLVRSSTDGGQDG